MTGGEPESKRPRLLSAWAGLLGGNGDFRRLWLASACNHFGMTGEQVILGLLVFEITRSSFWVGAALALYFLPLAVFGLLSGAIADRFDRRRLLRGIEFAIACNLAGFATLLAGDLESLWLVMLFTLISGSLRALYQPVRTSYAYDLVGGEQIVSGLAMLNLGTRLGQLAGALAAGYLMQRFGAWVGLLAVAGAHLGALNWLWRLASAGRAAVFERVPIRQNLGEYVQEIRSNRILLMIMVVTASVEIFGFSFTTALPELAAVRFEAGAEGLGMLHGSSIFAKISA